MARYTHVVSGARVEVRDDKVMDSSWEAVGGGQKAADGYDGMKVADLQAEIDKRNEGREEADLIPSDGKKADLIAALSADDTK
jgi:hypothetical protein